MIHLGDITKIRGDEIPPVDCITGGSPCQDLSVAGKRAGLEGERSGLFMEQIRIVKEMRERDRRAGRTAWAVRPRFMVWENVPGAFSSNSGKDFQAVLTEIVKIAEPDAPDVPLPDKGKWPKAGCLYSGVGDWSVAWRVHDAQFWGVPQRRKRIALVADFGGLSAPETLFEREGLLGISEPLQTQREGLSGDSEPCGTAREEAAAATGSGIEGAGGIKCINPYDPQSERVFHGDGAWHSLSSNSGGGQSRDAVYIPDVAHALSARHDGSPQPDKGNGANIVCAGFKHKASGLVSKGNGEVFLTPEKHMSLGCGGGQAGQGYPAVFCLQGNGIDRADTAGCNGKGWREDQCYTLNTIDRPAVYDARGNGDSEIVPTITGDHQSRVTDYTALCVGGNDIAQTLDASYYKGPGSRNGKEREVVATFQNTGRGWWNEHDVAATLRTPCGGDSTKANLVAAVDCRNGTENSGTKGTLQAKSNGGTSLNLNNTCRIGATVRRLTPLECERLQGFPDGWTDIGDWVDSKGKKHKAADSPRYKALGNSIALPFWFWLLRRISAQYERPATLGSLFDGIGGFPLCWERCNGKGTAIWASEIEEFPIAVTKKHFPEEKETT